MNLYGAQRTGFQPAMPKIALEPGMQRQTFVRSGNRSKRNPAGVAKQNKQMLLKLAQYKASGVI